MSNQPTSPNPLERVRRTVVQPLGGREGWHHQRSSGLRRLAAILAVSLIGAITVVAGPLPASANPAAKQTVLEPQNVNVVPGDGSLTVTWQLTPRAGFENDQIRHALRWSQVAGVWANPPGSRGHRNDGIALEGGVESYTITGLQNGIATGVFVRSFVGPRTSEDSVHSSRWVRVKGTQTTPQAAVPQPDPEPDPQPEPRTQPVQPQQLEITKTFSVSATARAAEGSAATLTVILSSPAPVGGLAFTVAVSFDGGATASSDDVGTIASSVTVGEGDTTVDIAVPTADDAVDEDDETFTVTIATAAEGWDKAGDGKDTATVTIADDDTAGVTITPTTLTIAEGESATYTVVLDSEPTLDMYVMVEYSVRGVVSVDEWGFGFTAEDWNVPRTITVTAHADDDSDDESIILSHGIFGPPSSEYRGFVAPKVTVTVTDTTPEPEPEPIAPTERPGPVTGLKVQVKDQKAKAGQRYQVAEVTANGLQLLANPKKVVVSWQAPESGGAPDNYIVHLKPVAGGKGKIHRPKAGKLTATFKNLKPGMSYRVWVRAKNDVGKGERTYAVFSLPAAPTQNSPSQVQSQLPGPVVGLQSLAEGTKVVVSWQAPESGGAPDNYIVHLKPVAGGKGKTHRPKAGKLTTTFRNLKPGTQYRVWVRAQNAAGKGERTRAFVSLVDAVSPPS